MNYKIETGVQKLKEEYKNLPEDVIQDIWILISSVLSSMNKCSDLSKRDAYLMLRKYYLKPDGTEYPRV